jgi:uncharacterized protein YecE (DUF72 family)
MIMARSQAPPRVASCAVAAGTRQVTEIGNSMKIVYAGTSGWAYSSWKPDFYPPKLSSAKLLNYYAGRLNSVEVNYTFRTLPTEKLLVGWMSETPPHFKFAVKANQAITHIKRLRNADKVTSEFIDSLLPLKEADKLGPILFQLPPNLKCDLSLLADFQAGLSRHVRSAFEFRHDSWFQDDVFALLRKTNAGLCLAESEELETPDVQTADFCYLRLRKDSYSAKARKGITQKVRRLAQEGEVFAYFKHEETPEGALYAEELLKAIDGKQA